MKYNSPYKLLSNGELPNYFVHGIIHQHVKTKSVPHSGNTKGEVSLYH